MIRIAQYLNLEDELPILPGYSGTARAPRAPLLYLAEYRRELASSPSGCAQRSARPGSYPSVAPARDLT